MLLDWIAFGEVSAERDTLLSEYFYDNGVVGRLIGNDSQFLVLGRKGAGKTAIFQHFAQNNVNSRRKGDLIITLSMQNYDWSVHALLSSEGKAPSLAYIQSWKYLIYLSAVRELAAHNNNSKIQRAHKIIKRIYTSPAPSLGEAIGSKLLQLTRLALPSGGIDLSEDAIDSMEFSAGEISFSEVRDNTSLQSKLNSTIGRLVDIFEDALLDVGKTGHKTYVCLDRVDEAWDRDSLDATRRMIAGLIGASEYITSKFQGSLRPIVFLREDIFDSISLNDKNKLRTDCGQLLAWNAGTLARVVLERVNYFARKTGNTEFSDLNSIFDKEKMRQSRKPLDYLITRTMMRPRDIIRFFELTRSDMIDRRDNPYEEDDINQDKLECEAVYAAEPAYSEWLLKELRDEWETQFPEINDLLDAIQHNASTNISKEELRLALRAVGQDPSPTQLLSHLRFLFDNSIIGFKPGNFQQWRFKCFHQSQGFVDAEIFKIHDGLTRALNLKEPRAA